MTQESPGQRLSRLYSHYPDRLAKEIDAALAEKDRRITELEAEIEELHFK